MNAVIKHGQHGRVRRFAPRSPMQPVLAVEIVDPIGEQRAALDAKIDLLTAALDAGRQATAAAVREAYDRGREEGKRAGQALAVDREADRLDTLRTGLAAAHREFSARLDSVDALAVRLARAALAKLFAGPLPTDRMVVATLARHADLLRNRRQLRVHVSGSDFADQVAAQGLSRMVPGATVTIDPDLPAGSCRISSALGSLDLDVPGQWQALDQLLDSMAAA